MDARRCVGADGGKVLRVRGPTDRNQNQKLRVICLKVAELWEVHQIVTGIHGDAVARCRHIGEGVNDVAQQRRRYISNVVILRVDGPGGEVPTRSNELSAM